MCPGQRDLQRNTGEKYQARSADARKKIAIV